MSNLDTSDVTTSTEPSQQPPQSAQPPAADPPQENPPADEVALTADVSQEEGANTQPENPVAQQQDDSKPAESEPRTVADADAMAVDAPAASARKEDDTNAVATEPIVESRIPVKKDETLREFLNKMDDYSPIIPDAVTNYYLTLAGLPPPPQTPQNLARLISLATQKFISDIAADAYQYARIRASNTSTNPLTGLAPGALGAPPGLGAGVGGGPGAGGGPGGGGAASGVGGGGKESGKAAHMGAPRAGFGGGGQGSGQGRTVLTMEDLGMAVGEYGINVKRGEFYR